MKGWMEELVGRLLRARQIPTAAWALGLCDPSRLDMGCVCVSSGL